LRCDARVIHRPEALLADLGQKFNRVPRQFSRPEAALSYRAWIDAAEERWNREMLLKRDDPH
jgi:hypothetical protein